MMKKSILLLVLFLGIQSSLFSKNNFTSKVTTTYSPECFAEGQAAADWLTYEWLNSGMLWPEGDPPSYQDEYEAFMQAYDDCEATFEHDEFQFGD